MQDYITVCRMVQNKQLGYITPALLKKDIQANELYLLKIDNKIVCFAARVYCAGFNNYAIKRLCVPNKKNKGKGYAGELLHYLITTRECNMDLVCTPWIDNSAMRHMLEKNGMKLKYVFDKVWCLYETQANIRLIFC